MVNWDDKSLTEWDKEIEYVGLRVGRLQQIRKEARKTALAKRKAEIDREVDKAAENAESNLVDALKEMYEAGVPAHVIRDGVFFGNYSTWGKWRDLAGIPKGRA